MTNTKQRPEIVVPELYKKAIHKLLKARVALDNETMEAAKNLRWLVNQDAQAWGAYQEALDEMRDAQAQLDQLILDEVYDAGKEEGYDEGFKDGVEHEAKYHE